MKENLFQKRVVLKQMNKKPQKTILKGKLLQQIVEQQKRSKISQTNKGLIDFKVTKNVITQCYGNNETTKHV